MAENLRSTAISYTLEMNLYCIYLGTPGIHLSFQLIMTLSQIADEKTLGLISGNHVQVISFGSNHLS